jgi:penicillin-binding protein 1B
MLLKIKKLKWILAAISIISLLSLSALFFWLFQLDEKITTQLKLGKFLPPTEYFSAPERFFVGMKINKSEIEKILNNKNYRKREPEQKIFPGDWGYLTESECHQLHEAAKTCLQFIKKKILPDEIDILQKLAFDETDLLVFTAPDQGFEFEPELIAQYIGDEPIMYQFTPLGEIPTQCLNAVLAIEDAKFLEHSGVSYTAILRAAFKNAFGSGPKQGGSTITQQMVKNYFLTNERTLKRKFHEFFMSLILETRASKDQILETYLNIIYLGQDGPFQVRGIQAAAQYYFNKKVSELILPECALLAAVVNGPGVYDPFRKPENANKRLKLVLTKMAELGFISNLEMEEALNYPLPKNNKLSVSETAPYYLNAVNKQIFNLGIDRKGHKIFTGLNLTMQKSAQESLRKNLSQIEANKKLKKNLEGAVLVADNQSGLVNAVVGGKSYRMTQFNRALDAHRQIGSIMKPIVFLAALLASDENQKIYDPMTPLHDEKTHFKYDKKTWSPDNYNQKYYGTIPTYFALKNSLNSATAELGLEIGLNQVIATARRLGVHSTLEAVPSLTLGAFEIYPIEVLNVYTNLARMGELIELSFIQKIYNEQGEQVYIYNPHVREVMDPAQVAVLVSMMKQTILSGTAKSVVSSGFVHPAAGKTGTTSDNRDAWFSGFTPYLTSLVWVGYDDNTSHGLTGASGALPIWISLMKEISNHYPESDFNWPEETEKDIIFESEQKVELVFKKGAKRSY